MRADVLATRSQPTYEPFDCPSSLPATSCTSSPHQSPLSRCPFRVLRSLQIGPAQGPPPCREHPVPAFLINRQHHLRELEPSVDLPSLQHVNLLSAQTVFCIPNSNTVLSRWRYTSTILPIPVIINNNSIQQLRSIHHTSGPELGICGISSHAQNQPAGQLVIKQHYR